MIRNFTDCHRNEICAARKMMRHNANARTTQISQHSPDGKGLA
jgi:hypothetical protein